MSRTILAACSLALTVIAMNLLMAQQARAGDFGRGVAVGIAGTVIVQDIQRRAQQQQPVVIIQQPPPQVIRVPSPNELNRTPRPTRQELCHFPGYHARVYDQYDMVMGYRVCY
jgi:hypothetical protein